MKNILFISSLLLIMVAVFLVIQYPGSKRVGLIAGVIVAMGFLLNVIAFIIYNRMLRR